MDGEAPRKGRQKMNTKTAIGEMIEKYAEVYSRALNLGFDSAAAHGIAERFFQDGFKSLSQDLRDFKTDEVA
jgi:2,4-dienoyl-CoA reductase-like NADH-dependent reductase (Old Yellow Enzyme family)